jgi:hypothetical protein
MLDRKNLLGIQYHVHPCLVFGQKLIIADLFVLPHEFNSRDPEGERLRRMPGNSDGGELAAIDPRGISKAPMQSSSHRVIARFDTTRPRLNCVR